MPLSTARGFPGCILERDAILRRNTFLLRTQKYLSPPNSLLRLLLACEEEAPSRLDLLSQGQTQFSESEAQGMEELTTC